jgi:hypothetical protein
VTFWPVTCHWLTERTGVDVALALGIDPSQSLPGWLSPAPLFWGWLVFAGCHYVLCLGERRGRAVRTGALLLAALHNGNLVLAQERGTAAVQVLTEAASGNIFERQWPGLQRLRILQYPRARLTALDSREALLRADLRTFADFHRYVVQRYRVHAPDLQKRWHLEDERRLKALFFMSFVSSLWAYGNRAEVDRAGCVLCNEERHGATPARPTLRTYLETGIACCTDYANLTKSLLDHEGLENRLAHIPGHIFNEVRLDGRWCVLDATTALVLETSWEELYAAPEGNAGAVTVLLFPHPGLRTKDVTQYRPGAGHLRVLMLLRVANRPALVRQVEHPGLPDYFD